MEAIFEHPWWTLIFLVIIFEGVAQCLRAMKGDE